MKRDIRLILASASPRRHQLVGRMGLQFEVIEANIDETVIQGEDPVEMVRRLSQSKAQAVSAVCESGIVVAADTTVVLDGEILNKPVDDADGMRMLKALRGRRHFVHTGLAILSLDEQRMCLQVATTPVCMRNYSDREIAAYVRSGDHLDKAGSYAIQSADFDPIEGIHGCWANVMGLPMCHLYRVLDGWQFDLGVPTQGACPFAAKQTCPWAASIVDAPSSQWCVCEG